MAKFRFYAFNKKEWIWGAEWNVKGSELPEYVKYGQGSFDIRGDHGIIVDGYGIVVATFDGKKFSFNPYYDHNYRK